MTPAEQPVVAGVAAAFLAAADHAGTILHHPAVERSWDRPSALAGMDVGHVAGHLFLVVRRVGKHLDEAPPPTGGSAPRTDLAYPRVDRAADLELAVHRQVRDDGRHVAGWGRADLVAAYDERVDDLRVRLVRPPAVVALGGSSMDFAAYLATRVVELVVHADDLVASVDVDVDDPPAEALQVALDTALAGARRVHGDLVVLRAFTRRERTALGQPYIY